MELDTKQKVLLGIYMEYQKDIPDMQQNIKADVLDLDESAFRIALEKLQNEKLITGAQFVYGGNQPYPYQAYTDSIKMTSYGIEYVERKLDIDPTLSNAEKVKSAAKITLDWGWDQIKDFSARVLAEVIKT